MKRFALFITAFLPLCIWAQPRIMSQAVINTKTTITAPDDDEAEQQNRPTGGDGEVRVMRFMGDGETTSSTFLKGDLIKTVSKSEMGNTITIRDNAKKTTTTLMEMMGRKTGIVATDEDQEAMRKRMDSMMQSRNPDQANPTSGNTPNAVIHYTEETKKIAGLNCKKAFLVVTRNNGNTDSSAIWYCPDFKLQGITSTGGVQGGPFGGLMRNSGLSALSQLEGFPMQYEMNMRRGRKMTVEVTKVDFEKEVKDKEFEIPSGYEMQSAKDMETRGGPGGFQIRIER